ncbi:MAG: hypothetical protein J5I93_30330 [Pirellulaceae bacterium]|nr:hypothetical protein [Pirellulaceae bacterium]
MRIALFAGAMLLLVAGCTRARYVVEITPDGAGFQRRLTAWKESAGNPPKIEELPPQEVQRISEQYAGQSSFILDGKRTFAGPFQGATPQDVGGAGQLRQFESPLGSSWIYLERFRGSDDVETQLSRRREAADRLADLLSGWLVSELREQPEAEAVRRFVEGDLRRDLRNLGVYAWTHRAVTARDGAFELEFAWRAGQYLAERDYLSAADLPGLHRAMSQNDPRRAAELLQRIVVRKIGIPADQPVPRSLEFLRDPERVGESISKYLRATEEFQQRQAAWQRKQAEDPESAGNAPDPMELVGEPLGSLFFNLSLGSDQLDVRLKLPAEPFDTNGQWQGETGTVNWSRSLVDQDTLPVLVYAAWSVPDQDVQMGHFGRVVLRDQALAEYALWHGGLSEQEAGEWGKLLASLRPGPGLVPALKAFRFSTDPPANAQEEPAPSLADRARELILAGL